MYFRIWNEVQSYSFSNTFNIFLSRGMYNIILRTVSLSFRTEREPLRRPCALLEDSIETFLSDIVSLIKCDKKRYSLETLIVIFYSLSTLLLVSVLVNIGFQYTHTLKFIFVWDLDQGYFISFWETTFINYFMERI